MSTNSKPISRRGFLGKSLALGCGLSVWGAFPNLFEHSAYAATSSTKLLFLNLNGGWDGLSICQPRSGAALDAMASLRPTLISDASALLNIDGNFGFNAQLPVFKSLLDEGRLAAILNVGYKNMSRSHQDAEVAYARGVSDRLNQTQGGFLSRMGSAFGWNALSAVSVTGSDFFFSGGQYSGIMANGLSNFYFTGDNTQSWTENGYRRDLLYGMASDITTNENKAKQKEIVNALHTAIDTTDDIKAAVAASSFSATYPDTYLGRALKDIDILFSSSTLGTQVGYLRRGGFDTHSKQAEVMNSMLPEINAALLAFVTNMKAKGLWQNLIVVIMSEFGRTNQENGSAGTDHGGALPFFLLGGKVNGGLYGSLSSSDLLNNPWLPMHFNVLEIYRQTVAALGYDPNLVFEAPGTTQLPSLFS